VVHAIRKPPPAAIEAESDEALPYCILRRMSTDGHGAAPIWAGAVIVSGLVGSALGARPCAEVTQRRSI
jgi:hypothetical protein